MRRREFIAGFCGAALMAAAGAGFVLGKSYPFRSAHEQELYDTCLANGPGDNTVQCDAVMRLIKRKNMTTQNDGWPGRPVDDWQPVESRNNQGRSEGR